ncbi:phage antirepressor KilAC domain-containing protein [Clostridium facile]|uniref:Phage antirepressor KilAC domain-containing protein n=1 Tax=Clostridium facile TaxID=2763035 RepID=A0ABR7INP1_9CLOT|nr:phage antirepressor KilAC domain-containing protein [Clostridium facile]MBC5786750.1 phage antirepressor KilAC domain-containing protein [Clostridium facile]
MNELQIFKNEQFGEIRTIEENGKVLFCGKDVCAALGYKDSTSAMKQHCRGVVKHHLIDSLGRKQQTNFIPEGDIYRLAAKSELPGAEKFESWIFDEVLPAIHKHGAYMTPETLEAALLNPDTIIKIATALKDEQEKNKVLQAENSALTVDNAIMQPKADYFDELVDRNLLTNLRETAKQLNIKEREFIRFLLDHKYLYRDKRGKLMPYAQHIEKGLFQLKEQYNEKTNWSGTQTLITPKGRETFRLLYLKAVS